MDVGTIEAKAIAMHQDLEMEGVDAAEAAARGGRRILVSILVMIITMMMQVVGSHCPALLHSLTMLVGAMICLLSVATGGVSVEVCTPQGPNSGPGEAITVMI